MITTAAGLETAMPAKQLLILPGCGFCGRRGDNAQFYPVRIIQPDGTMGDRLICLSCVTAVDVTSSKRDRDLEAVGWHLADVPEGGDNPHLT